MSASTAPRLRLAAAAVLLSTAGAAIKASSLSSWQVAGLRSAFATIVFALAIPGALRRWSWPTLAVGAAYAANMLLFVWANKLTTAANTIFLQSASPLYVLLLSPWLLAEPIRARDLGLVLVVGIGLALFFLDADQTWATAPNPTLGNVLAVLGGFAWALTVIGLRWIGVREREALGAQGAALVAGNLMLLLVCAPAAPSLDAISPRDWLLTAYLGVFQLGAAYLLITSAMRQVSALEASLVLLLEPVLNPIWAWALHGERPGPWSLVGGVVILVATAVRARNGTARIQGGRDARPY